MSVHWFGNVFYAVQIDPIDMYQMRKGNDLTVFHSMQLKSFILLVHYKSL